MKIIEVKPGEIGIYHKSGTRTIRNTIIKCANSRTATAIKQVGGTLILENVFIDGGTGPQIWGGDEFKWIGGGSVGTTRAYGVGYYGNIHPGAKMRIKKVTLAGLRFPHHSTDEALLRVMGCDDMAIVDCEFDNRLNTAKPCAQWRHVKKLWVGDSDILGHANWGTLRPKDCKSEAEREAYIGDAKQFRISAFFDKACRLGGYGILTGQADVTFEGKLDGPFVRPNCFSLETIAGIKSPTLNIAKAVNQGWKRTR